MSLLELSQYHFPNLSPKELSNEPYKTYMQTYCSVSSEFKFYRGFITPDITLKAKIYRAIYNTHSDDCMIFQSNHGLVIKKKKKNWDEFDQIFNRSLDQSENHLFIPPGYHQINRLEYAYYHELLSGFKKNYLPDAEIVRFCENNNSDFLFLSLSHPVEDNLTKVWHQFVQGGIHRKILLQPHQVKLAYQLFPWNQRVSCSIVDGQIEMTVRLTSLDQLAERTRKIFQEADNDQWALSQVEVEISSEIEAFALIRILKINDLIPLVGTSWVVIPKMNLGEIKTLSIPERSNEMKGSEVFTQIEFSEMSPLQQIGLYNNYSILGLVEYLNTGAKEDPLTRETFSDELIKEVAQIVEELRGPFLEGFPSSSGDPQLLTTILEEEKIISFYYQNDERHLFWRIPDLRDTEWAHLTFEAIKILVIKWSDRSIFNPTKFEKGMNTNLIFNPSAYSVFEKSLKTKYTSDLKILAENLQQQIVNLA